MRNEITQELNTLLKNEAKTNTTRTACNHVSKHLTGAEGVSTVWNDSTSSIIWVAIGRVTRQRVDSLLNSGIQFSSRAATTLSDGVFDGKFVILGLHYIRDAE